MSVVLCLPAHLCVSPQRPVAGPPRERVSRSRVWLPTRELRVPPWCRIGISSGWVHLLVLVRPAVKASSSTFALATLAFAMALGRALATVLVGVALATALATAVLGVELRRKALLVVALVFLVLPLPTERTGGCAPVVVRHLGFAAVVGLLLLPLAHKTVLLVTVKGMKHAAPFVSGFTPEEMLDIAYEGSILGGSTHKSS